MDTPAPRAAASGIPWTFPSARLPGGSGRRGRRSRARRRPAGRCHAAQRAHRDRVVSAEYERRVPAAAASHTFAAICSQTRMIGPAYRASVALLGRLGDRRATSPQSSTSRPSDRGARSAPRSGSPTAPCRRPAGLARGRARPRSPRQACASRSVSCSRRPRLPRAATLGARGEVAQLVEHTAENRGVAGSSPALAISGKKGTKRDVRTGATASRTSRGARAYDRSSLRASRLSPGPDEKIATCEKLRRSSLPECARAAPRWASMSRGCRRWRPVRRAR